MSRSEAVLTAQGLCKNYVQGERRIQVLADLELNVGTNEKVAIVGRSGSGKSTLLSLLAGLDGADSGSVRYQGTSLESLDEKALTRLRARSIGIVFQHFHLVSTLTALENVALPLEICGEKNASTRAQAELERVGLAERCNHFPFQLSGGEAQRVAIARALVMRPPVLLADEPSGSLDEDTGESVLSELFHSVEEAESSLVLVTHNPEIAQRCDRILRLEHGKLLEDGKARKVTA